VESVTIGFTAIIIACASRTQTQIGNLNIVGFGIGGKPVNTTNKTGKFEEWLRFFLEAIKVQSEDALDRTIKLEALRESYIKQIDSEKQVNNLLKVINGLFFNPFIQIRQVASQLKVTYPTAKKAANTLVKLKILKEAEDKERNKIFVAQDILNIITI